MATALLWDDRDHFVYALIQRRCYVFSHWLDAIIYKMIPLIGWAQIQNDPCLNNLSVSVQQTESDAVHPIPHKQFINNHLWHIASSHRIICTHHYRYITWASWCPRSLAICMIAQQFLWPTWKKHYNMTVWHFGPCVTFWPCLCDISARLVWHFGPLVPNEGKRVSPYPHINHWRRL